MDVCLFLDMMENEGYEDTINDDNPVMRQKRWRTDGMISWGNDPNDELTENILCDDGERNAEFESLLNLFN